MKKPSLARIFSIQEKIKNQEYKLKTLKDIQYAEKKKIIEYFENNEIQSIKDKIGRSVSLMPPRVYAHINNENKMEALKWFKENDLGWAIKEEINNQTLSRIIKERLKTHDSFPENLISYHLEKNISTSKSIRRM